MNSNEVVEVLKGAYYNPNLFAVMLKHKDSLKAIEIAIRIIRQNDEREKPKPLLSNEDDSEMVCPYCTAVLSNEFTEPHEEKYCPFCGFAIDIFHCVKETRLDKSKESEDET